MKLVILGGGESGIGAAILAKKNNYKIFLSDYGKISDNYLNTLVKENIHFEEGKHSTELMEDADLVVKSPGIPDDSKIVKFFTQKDIPVISEIEFAGRFTSAKIICITGSNGKTTTALLLYDILKKGGINVGLAGNIGTSFALSVATHNYDYYVIEISSFQIDGLKNFKCDCAVITNITPDHLDRYNNLFENYIKSKLNLLKFIKPSGKLIVCADDKHIMDNIKDYNVNDVEIDLFTLKKIEDMKAHIDKDNLVIKTNEGKLEILLSDLSLKGKHNVFNSMAAAIVSNSVGVKNKAIRKSLVTFKNIEHRLEYVLKVRDVEFINDSKATNVNSTWYALECMQKPVIWIAGGTDKGNDYSEIEELVYKKIKAIVCIAVETEKFDNYFKRFDKPLIYVTSMEEAVKKSFELAERNDIVLLSPACASFDRFKSYKQRGNAFKSEVKKL